jgi:hypothetical protein
MSLHINKKKKQSLGKWVMAAIDLTIHIIKLIISIVN